MKVSMIHSMLGHTVQSRVKKRLWHGNISVLLVLCEGYPSSQIASHSLLWFLFIGYAAEQAVEKPVIRYTMTSMWRHCNDATKHWGLSAYISLTNQFPRIQCEQDNDDVIKWKHLPRYWPFVRGIHRWITLTKASDAELWCFLWCSSEQTVE